MDYRVGDIIEYTTFLGAARRVKVVGRDANIKNGRPGFDAELVDGETALGTTSVWGYDDQIVRVVASR